MKRKIGGLGRGHEFVCIEGNGGAPPPPHAAKTYEEDRCSVGVQREELFAHGKDDKTQ